MRKLMIALAGASALALGSAAGATVTVTGSTGLNNPNPTTAGSIQTVGTTTTINFGTNPAATPGFSASFTLMNTEAGLYSIVLQTSDGDLTFSSASLTGPGACAAGCALTPFPTNQSLKLIPAVQLLAGTYTFAFAGNNPVIGGSATGNVTITPAVPEPGTWAMMLLGFGAIGLSVRSRRRPALAQIA